MIDMPPANQSAASEMVSVKMLTMGDPASVFSIQSVFHKHGMMEKSLSLL